MKRVTIRRMLKQRLVESKRSIQVSERYEDLVNVMGGDNSKESQHRINMQKDIEDLNFLLFCIENKEAIESNREWLQFVSLKPPYQQIPDTETQNPYSPTAKWVDPL